MDARERLTAAFDGQEVDRKPCICPGGMMNMVTTELLQKTGILWEKAHVDAQAMADLAQASFDYHCFDNVGVPFCMTIESEALGARVVLGDNCVEPHVADYAIQDASAWNTLPAPDVTKGRMAVVVQAIRILRQRNLDAPIVGNVVGPMSVASSVQDAVCFYKDLRKRPDDAHAFLDYVTRCVSDFACAQAAAGADVIVISDPGGTGEILGPKYFEEYTVRYLNQVLDSLRAYPVKTVVHICGQMHNVYQQVNMVRSDALSFDAVVNLSKARPHLGNHLLMGNVSTFAIERSDASKVATLSRAAAREADIVAPACGLGTGSALGNVQAVMAALE